MTETFTDGGLLQRISARLPYLPPSLRLVAEAVLKSPERAQSMTITELALAAGVGESTVSRFVRELGVDGYKSLLLGLAEATFISKAATQEQSSAADVVYEGVNRGDSPEDIVGKVERSSIQSLRRTGQRQDIDAIQRAVDMIDAANTLVFCCMGSSSIAAEEAVMRFTRAGKKCMLYRDTTIQVMLATILAPGDLLIGISDSGQSTPIIEALHLAQQRGAATLAITGSEGSPLLEHADTALFTATVPSGGELYGESVTSKWGQLLVIDILYAAYATRHYDATVKNLKETYQSSIRQSRRSS
ncbi:MurR/RpiR family transcriptional regulator [Paenarthrobacter ureafaciens]|uniref:MurR/RpiR family transcriptional regulator n=1 Tax=Micrococcaceae TaxID=1268 RepID=UPI000317C57E|nr:MULTISPECIES: MurR/RpiR family transcriptional regulator [Micrococcaceae]MEC3851867.1 MurR/RpiR family transcriptional regulator [Paenarthrobacter ureafaciens]NWL27349.1 MurR/RpiR family transcriptional regulator [Paenarthrobacter ureafaciens]QSZ52677.1 RpiR family transcriptional regulator [Paenarthrobacter ureafaciens]UOD80809.1 MurR/RpiR family transcriptional regulator [Paenarthrobacter ureafaciens]WNZ03468.1 MurR/RpiR family transcriptional regulator [Paenarthrobacter ureafaciens]